MGPACLADPPVPGFSVRLLVSVARVELACPHAPTHMPMPCHAPHHISIHYVPVPPCPVAVRVGRAYVSAPSVFLALGAPMPTHAYILYCMMHVDVALFCVRVCCSGEWWNEGAERDVCLSLSCAVVSSQLKASQGRAREGGYRAICVRSALASAARAAASLLHAGHTRCS